MTNPTVLKVPQWQGSSSPTAHRLAEGADRLSALIPAGDRLSPHTTDQPGSTRDGVRNADALTTNLATVRATLARLPERPLVTVGGDCGIEFVPIEAAHHRYGDRLAVVWFDAHGDLNTPASSPSGAYHGMVLRALLGEGPTGLSLDPAHALDPRRVVLAGVRALDPGEREYTARHGVHHLTVADLADPSLLLQTIAATGADTVYVHLDLDVLDPETFASVGCPEPDGLTPDRLSAAISALAGRFRVAGFGITEYEPSRPADEATLAALIPALTGALLDRG